MSIEPEKWSSREEISEHLGVIPQRRIGKQYKIKISEVDAWVDSGKSAEIE